MTWRGRRTDADTEADKDVGYGAKRIMEECSIMGLEGIER